jgi:HEAT repeat protein
MLRGDLSQVEAAKNLLLKEELPRQDKDRLLYGISELTSPAAVASVKPLLSAYDVELRRAAAKALWHIADPEASDVLLAALNDSDRDVRYYAVRALAEIAHQPDWGPGPAEFEDHEGKYLDHWRRWKSGRSKEPPRL